MSMSGTEVFAGLFGGVALLLWGLRMVRVGVSRAFIWELRQLLGWCLSNRLRGFASGIVLAICLQSGTATALLLASFVDIAGIPAATALAVIMGSDLGSAIMVKFLSLEISALSPILVFLGYLLFQSKKHRRCRNAGRILFGAGLMLLALQLISGVASVLGEATTLQSVITALSEEYVLILSVSAGLAWMMHSSIAMVLLIAALASYGVLSEQAACLFVLGANVGASIPALIGTLGSPSAVLRAPLANIICRASSVAIIVPFLGFILPWLPWLGTEIGVQIVLFHVGFNFASGAFWLFCSAPVLRLCQLLVPDRAPEDKAATHPVYLNRDALASPTVALTNAIHETLRMGEYLETMLTTLARALQYQDAEMARRVKEMDDVIDRFYAEIRIYLGGIEREYLSEVDSRRSTEILIFVTNLEHIGDIIDVSLVPDIISKIKQRLQLPAEEEAFMGELFERIRSMMHLSYSVFQSRDVSGARRLLHEKTAVRERKDEVIDAHMKRLHQGGIDGNLSSAVFLDALQDLHRIASHLAEVANPLLQSAGELYQDRLRPETGGRPADGATAS